jgi:hypothetical protein
MGSRDFAVRVWDVDTGKQVSCLVGHEDGISSITYSHDGHYIVSGGKDQTLRVWDALSRSTMNPVVNHSSAVKDWTYSSSGRWVVSGAWDRTMRLWDANNGEQLACWSAARAGVFSVAFSPDERQVFSKSFQDFEDSVTTIQSWDLETGSCVGATEASRSPWSSRYYYDPTPSGPFLDFAEDRGAFAKPAVQLGPFVGRASYSDVETVIELTNKQIAVAWYSSLLERLETHPSGRSWAGIVRDGSHIHLFKLECEGLSRPEFV